MDHELESFEPHGPMKVPLPPFPDLTEVTWDTVRQWQDQALDFLLVDVREAEERAAGHAGGLWIPLGELHGRIGELRRGVPVAFYCRKGIRSLIAVQRFRHRLEGVPVYSVEGLEGRGG